jgi:drug/metabolite transporter (DMT)-like permease
MTAYACLVLAIALNMAGHLMFKLGAVASTELLRAYVSPFAAIGFLAYGLSALGYIAALRTMALSVAMPSMVVGYLGTAVLAHWIWGEAFGPKQVAAFALIALGLYLLHR